MSGLNGRLPSPSGTSGIGQAVTHRLVKGGAHLVTTGRRHSEPDKAMVLIDDSVPAVRG
jgi:NADP-dependent 3-hydroxy acid dehydrogenase YdfG